MDAFFESGHAADVVLAVLAIEALWLWRHGNHWADVITVLMPAVLMMIAVRAALTGMAWPFVSLPLAIAFPVHLYDLRRRRMLKPSRK